MNYRECRILAARQNNGRATAPVFNYQQWRMNTTLNYRDTKSSRILVGKTAFFPVSPANIAAIAAPEVAASTSSAAPAAPAASAPSRAGSSSAAAAAGGAAPPKAVIEFHGMAHTMYETASAAFASSTPFDVAKWYVETHGIRSEFFQIGRRFWKYGMEWKVSQGGRWHEMKGYQREMEGIISIIDSSNSINGADVRAEASSIAATAAAASASREPFVPGHFTMMASVVQRAAEAAALIEKPFDMSTFIRTPESTIGGSTVRAIDYWVHHGLDPNSHYDHVDYPAYWREIVAAMSSMIEVSGRSGVSITDDDKVIMMKSVADHSKMIEDK